MEILLIDDHALFREGMRHLLSRLGTGVRVFEAGSAEAALALAPGMSGPDLILLDLQLPGTHGLAGLALFRQRFPSTPVVLLSGISDPATVREGIARGAQGFVPKAVSGDQMLAALRRVLEGEQWVPAGDAEAPATAPLPAGAVAAPPLTPRQAEVLSHLCDGRSNKEIGRVLLMSENTVRSHLAAIFRALGARSRTEAAALARRLGWV